MCTYGRQHLGLTFLQICIIPYEMIFYFQYSIFVFSESQTEVNTLEQELKRSSEVVLDLERRLRLLEDEKAAFEKVCQELYLIFYILVL